MIVIHYSDQPPDIFYDLQQECNPVKLYLDDSHLFYSKSRKKKFNNPAAAREAHTHIKTNYISSKKRIQIRKQNKQKYTKIQQFFSDNENEESEEKKGDEEQTDTIGYTDQSDIRMHNTFSFDVCEFVYLKI